MSRDAPLARAHAGASTRIALASIVLLASSSCTQSGSGGTGNLQVFIVPEASITLGIDAGSSPENLQDGWSVRYSKFLVTVGNFRAHGSLSGESLTAPTVYVLDLTAPPAGGYVTATLGDVAAGRYDKVGEDMPRAKAGVSTLGSTSAADVKTMVDNGWSLYFEGEMTKPDGASCKPTDPTSCRPAARIRFKWGFAIGTSFDDCASVQGDTGFVVPVGGSVQVKPTLHGDHWFFSNVSQGSEVTRRYAQYIADSDLDGDGETTLDELRRVKAADVFPTPKYKLSGNVGNLPIATAYDYVAAQARTLHDFQGDGECPTRVILE